MDDSDSESDHDMHDTAASELGFDRPVTAMSR